MDVNLIFQNKDDIKKVVRISFSGDPIIVKALEAKLRELNLTNWTEL